MLLEFYFLNDVLVQISYSYFFFLLVPALVCVRQVFMEGRNGTSGHEHPRQYSCHKDNVQVTQRMMRTIPARGRRLPNWTKRLKTHRARRTSATQRHKVIEKQGGEQQHHHHGTLSRQCSSQILQMMIYLQRSISRSSLTMT